MKKHLQAGAMSLSMTFAVIAAVLFLSPSPAFAGGGTPECKTPSSASATECIIKNGGCDDTSKTCKDNDDGPAFDCWCKA
ncbi:MAG: hypothetical protein KF847_01705 [Pirellulales bacterium]|nr:hypothetical protein [Pirellulales bacterium]